MCWQSGQLCPKRGNKTWSLKDISEPRQQTVTKLLTSFSIVCMILDVLLCRYQNIEEIDQTIEKMIEKVDGVWKCMTCGRTDKLKGHMKEHVEIHIDGLSFPCQFCDKTYSSRPSLRTHINKRCGKQ